MKIEHLNNVIYQKIANFILPRGFSGILLQNTYRYTNLKQIPGDGRKSGGASAPPSLAPMPISKINFMV